LVDRALEHDAPSELFRQLLVHLRANKIVRPGLDRLMRAVAAARSTASDELYRMTSPVLTNTVRRHLDGLIETDPDHGVAPRVWLTTGATTTSGAAIKAEVAKRDRLRHLGADRIELAMINPDRRRHLAGVARRSSPAALRRIEPERRYPLLAAAVVEIYTDLIDELVLLFDQALSGVETGPGA
jgi:hypothetical protein